MRYINNNSMTNPTQPSKICLGIKPFCEAMHITVFSFTCLLIFFKVSKKACLPFGASEINRKLRCLPRSSFSSKLPLMK